MPGSGLSGRGLQMEEDSFVSQNHDLLMLFLLFGTKWHCSFKVTPAQSKWNRSLGPCWATNSSNSGCGIFHCLRYVPERCRGPQIYQMSLDLSVGFVCGVFAPCWLIIYSDFMVDVIRLLLHICIHQSASALETIPCQPNTLFSWCLSGRNIWLCFAGPTPNPFSYSSIFPSDSSRYFLIHFTHFPGWSEGSV